MPYDVNIRPIAPNGLLNLRAGTAAREQIGKVLGVELPQRPNATAAREELRILCLGPDEWLLRVPDGDERRWQVALCQDVAAGTAAITVVTDAYVVVELMGREAREILSQGTEFDTHDRAFRPELCARIRFAKAQVILHAIDAAPTYHLYVPRSYERYLLCWLRSASGG